MIEFSGKKSDWKSWSGKFLARENRRGYKKLLVGEGKTVGVDKVATKTEFEEAKHGSSVQDEAVKKLGDLNVLAYENILYTKIAAGKVAFNLVNACYSFLKKIVDLYGITSIQSLSQILFHPFLNYARSL